MVVGAICRGFKIPSTTIQLFRVIEAKWGWKELKRRCRSFKLCFTWLKVSVVVVACYLSLWSLWISLSSPSWILLSLIVYVLRYSNFGISSSFIFVFVEFQLFASLHTYFGAASERSRYLRGITILFNAPFLSEVGSVFQMESINCAFTNALASITTCTCTLILLLNCSLPSTACAVCTAPSTKSNGREMTGFWCRQNRYWTQYSPFENSRLRITPSASRDRPSLQGGSPNVSTGRASPLLQTCWLLCPKLP
jgi:hypothetical protein